MDTALKRKIRVYAYYGSLIIVAIFAIYGFKLKKANPEPVKKEMEMSQDASLTAKDGDMINIDFDGYVDGEAIENGSTQGQGMDVTIGASKLLDGMEEQLIGHHPGDTFTMTITFADDYKTKELRGKEATLETTINGIYVEKESK